MKAMTTSRKLFLCTLIFCLTDSVLAATTYVAKDIGSLGSPGQGNVETSASAINAKGEVTGQSVASVVSLDPFIVIRHAFLYSGGTMIDLGTLDPSTPGSAGFSINLAGDIVGFSLTSGSVTRSVLFSPNFAVCRRACD
jgi:probable HAF family extracellular repeat protein